jgi:hypothetical protein
VPRRLLECFDITVVESPHGCLPQFYSRGDDRKNGSDPYGLGYLNNFIPEDSLLYRIIVCLAREIAMLRERFTQNEGAILLSLLSQPGPSPGVTLAQAHALVCRFKQVIMEMLADDEHPVRCQMRRAAAEIVLAAPVEGDVAAEYWLKARDAYRDLLAVFFQLILDCICHAFLPQCDDDPCDDRVQVACVTVKGDKILRICNHSCRRYAGAFPSVFYWMSLVPILPLIGKLLAWLCCQPDLLRKNSPLVNDLFPLLDRIDPSGNIRKTLTANNFAVPRLYLKQLVEANPAPLLTEIVRRFDAGVAPAAHTGNPSNETSKILKSAGVSVSEREVRDESMDELDSLMARKLLLQPGDNAIIYKKQGKVVAIVAEEGRGIESLRDEVAELRKQVAALSSKR